MSIKITHYEVTADVEKDLKFLFFSDLHNHNNKPLLEAIMSSNANAVLVGGDFMHNHLLNERGFEFLTEAAKILPTFCCLGNHEWRYQGDIRSRILKTGATLLDNEFVTFNGIKIGGITSGIFYHNNLPNAEFLTHFSQQSGFKLLLCHHPEYYPKYIKDVPIDLILSGHAHGGQWRLFGRGAYAPGQGILPKYTGGIYDGRLIVSRGIGNVYPVPKINNPPEILEICIKKQ